MSLFFSVFLLNHRNCRFATRGGNVLADKAGLKTPPARPRFCLKRWVLSALLLRLAIVGFPILKEYYARWRAREELAEVISIGAKDACVLSDFSLNNCPEDWR
jgi:hypothetical protein